MHVEARGIADAGRDRVFCAVQLGAQYSPRNGQEREADKGPGERPGHNNAEQLGEWPAGRLGARGALPDRVARVLTAHGWGLAKLSR